MDRYAKAPDVSSDSPPSEDWLFAQAILGRPIPRVVSPEVKAKAHRAELERVAQFSFRHAQELRNLQAAEAEARRDRELLEWAAQISTRAEDKLRALQRKEAEERDAWRRAEQLCEAESLSLTEWNEGDHPRAPKGTPVGGQWASKGGGASIGALAGGKSSSFLDKIIQRNRMVSELTGVVTPSMIRSTRIAAELQSAARLPGEVARAAAAGLGTGGKAVVNGFATAVKDVATLGLSSGQLELIGVTKEDRERGYDTAVSISTASGQVLIAVGTGGIASALSKGGSVARTASGALVAYDAAGNAVGVIKGVHDAANNGVNVADGAQVAGGLLGLTANVKSVRGLHATSPTKSLAPTPRRASLGRAPSANYRKTFLDAHPDRQGEVIVHHGIEQRVLKKYPGVLTESELHSLENLRGIPKTANSEFHLKTIRKEWDAFYKQHPEQVTKEQLLDKATEIDEKYRRLFDPPIR